MKVIVCGAGIAGLALAWRLERAGWDVQLVERAPEFRAGGYMIDFYGPGYQVAERMGLRERLLDARYPVHEISYVDGRGRQSSHLSMPSGLPDVVSLLRGDLARILLDDVSAPVRYGTSIDAVEHDAGGVAVRLTDGTTMEADLLVGADGAHSRVRELVFGEEERYLRYLGHQVAAYVVADQRLSEQVGTRYQMLTEPGLMAGAYALRGGRLALLFLRREPDPRIPADPPAALRERYGHLGWILPDVLGRCPQPPELYYDQVTQVVMDDWSRGRVVLLGDACQAVSLFAGHGASMAMAAAWVLADELTGEPAGGLTGGPAGGPAAGRAAGRAADPAAAALAYQRRMQPVIADVQRFGRRFIQWMAPSSRRRIVTRDWLLRLAALPGGRRLFLNSLSPAGHNLIPEDRRARLPM
ncbi:NAD(P)-binding protein [Nonomuraea sp. NN258]|uniref:FAD-dependent oxidoreductase n=1 Tax=Nonomuraea antri TaxID=2730852 RepID=UPI001569FEDE|nr:FAD-dependent oxidoreductase [Nonomuraea antri]NRQ38761.1 NAD(P)-binding protein [Nonomuraea antri]